MPPENIELAKQGIAAINESYRKNDIAPWRQEVAKSVHPNMVLAGGPETFTEGKWHGQEGLIGFVANQMEVLKDM